MSDVSKIQWCDATWNPTRGCSRVSPGCEHCYAETVAGGIAKKAYAGLTRPTSRGPVWTGEVRLVPHLLEQPLRWREPRRIFVDSMSDLFHEAVPDDYIDKVFAVMALAPQHTFQVLTKRPERMRDYFKAEPWDRINAEAGVLMHYDKMPRDPWFFENVWIGASAENEEMFRARVAPLSDAAWAIYGATKHVRPDHKPVAFLSLEPLLGPIDLAGPGGGGWLPNYPSRPGWKPGDCQSSISWVIVGGESGPRARPCDVAWIRSIVRQCQEAKVPAFVKQVGSRCVGSTEGFLVDRYELPDGRWFVPAIIGERAWLPPEEFVSFRTYHSKGGEPREWPEDLRVREMPA